MWMVIVREPRPDAVEWAGRRWLAAIDALMWPMAWVWLVQRAPMPTGVVGQVVTGMAVLCALARLRRALLENQRYWFTTWRWGRILFCVWVAGVAMKLATAG